MKKLSLKDFQQRLDVIHPMEKLKAIEWNGNKQNSIVECQLCKNQYTKMGGYFLDKRKKSICKLCFPTQPNILKKDWIPPEGYELLSDYNGMHHKIIIKHLDCGFIWGITPANLKLGKGCPKCNKKISKGEQKIKIWLENHNIEYLFQYPIYIKNYKLIIDFYLPAYDLFIEYNGEQHYFPIDFFGGDEKFEKQKYNDLLKQNYLKEKLLIIPYTDFENIETILESSTTIREEYAIS